MLIEAEMHSKLKWKKNLKIKIWSWWLIRVSFLESLKIKQEKIIKCIFILDRLKASWLSW